MDKNIMDVLGEQMISTKTGDELSTVFKNMNIPATDENIMLAINCFTLGIIRGKQIERARKSK